MSRAAWTIPAPWLRAFTTISCTSTVSYSLATAFARSIALSAASSISRGIGAVSGTVSGRSIT